MDTAQFGPNSRLHVAGLVLYALFVTVPALAVGMAYASGDYGGISVATTLAMILAVATAMLFALAGFTAQQSPGKKIGAGSLGIAFLLVQLFTVSVTSGGLTGESTFAGGWPRLLALLLAPALLFASWALARPLRGRGYLALVVGAALVFASSFVPLLPVAYSSYVTGTVIGIVVSLITIAATVGSAVLFENGAARSAPLRPVPSPAAQAAQQQTPYAPAAFDPAARSNGFAIAALVLGLVGGTWLAILFGYLAKSQIRRTGEGGSGMATAGIVLGFVSLAAVIVLTIIYVVYLVSIANAFGGFGYRNY